MMQLELFPKKTTFEVEDRVRFIKDGNYVPVLIGSIGTVIPHDNLNARSICVIFDYVGYNCSWYCLPESLEHI